MFEVIADAATATTQPTGDLNMDLQPQTPIGGILDLIGAQVQYTFSGAPAATTLNSPFTTTDFATYLPQFEMAIKDGGAESVMCAYNRVDGKAACASPRLEEDILRKQWGFKGYIVSDCGARPH